MAPGTSRDFGSVLVGQTSATAVFTLQFAAAETVGSMMVLTEGADGGDFAALPGGAGSCRTGNYAAGSSCTVAVAFTPAVPGLRRGAIVLTDGQVKALVTALVQGTGSGAQLVFEPGTARTADPEGFAGPVTAMASDGQGNLYTNEAGGLIRHGADGSISTWLADSGVSCLATDGAGRVYACVEGALAEFAADGSVVSGAVGPVSGSGAGATMRAVGVAVDGLGDLFVAEVNPATSLADIREINAAGQSNVLLTLPAGEVPASGLAVDGSGNLYAPSSQALRVVRTDGSSAILARGDFSTNSAAADAAGTIYLADGKLTAPGIAPQFRAGPALTSGQQLLMVSGTAFALNSIAAGPMIDAAVGVASGDGMVTDGWYRLARAGAQNLPAFPQTQIGMTSAGESFEISNEGNAPLALTGISVDGPFALAGSDACASGATLAPGASCGLTVEFQPQAAGTASGILAIAGAVGKSWTVALNGTGIAAAPTFAFAPGELDFGESTVGSTVVERSITVTNTGRLAVTFSGGAAITGTNAADFTVTASTCAGSLAPGNSCPVEVGYSPAALGRETATLTIPSDAPRAPALALSGAGTDGSGAALEVSFSDHDFGTVLAERQSAPVVLTILNASPGALVLGVGPVRGIDSADFAITATSCPAQLLANTSCTVTLAFTPGAAGTRSAVLDVSAPGSTLGVGLNGSGGAVAALTTDSAPIGFGPVPVGTSASATYKFGFAAEATVGSVSALFEGASGRDYEVVPGAKDACVPGMYAAGNACSVTVTFTPAAEGVRRGAVVLADTAGQPLATAYIWGTGTSGTVEGSQTGTGAAIALGTIPPVSQVVGIAEDGGGRIYLGLPEGTFKPAEAAASVVEAGTAVGLAFDGAGNLFAADGVGALVKRSPGGGMTTVGSHSGITGVAVDMLGDVYAVDPLHVYEITPDGTEQTLRTYGYLPASEVSTGPTGGIAVDEQGNVQVLTCLGTATFHPDGSYTAPAGTACAPDPQSALAVDATGKQWEATAGGGWLGVAVGPDGSLLYVAGSTSANTLYQLPPEPARQPSSSPQSVTLAWAQPAPTVYGTPLGAAQLDAVAPVQGTFSYSPTAGAVLDAGVHRLGVTFTPTDEADYAPATASVSFTVMQAPETVSVAASPVRSTAGSPVTLTAALSLAATGEVTFRDGTVTLGSAPLDGSGKGEFTTSELGSGEHLLTASYAGDSNHTGAVSAPVTVEVAADTAVLATSQPSLALGPGQGSGTLAVSVQPPAGFTGTVTFRCDGLPQGASCLFSPANLQVGNGVAASPATQLTIRTENAQNAGLRGGYIGGQAPAMPEPFSAAIFMLPGWMGSLPLASLRRRRVGRLGPGLLALMLLPLGCGGSAAPSPASASGSQGTAQTYVVTVTANGVGSASFTQTARITLTVAP